MTSRHRPLLRGARGASAIVAGLFVIAAGCEDPAPVAPSDAAVRRDASEPPADDAGMAADGSIDAATSDRDSGGLPGGLELVHGQRATVRGAGFGAHPDLHSDDERLVVMWETFESGDFLSNPYRSWSIFNPAAVELIDGEVDGALPRHAAKNRFFYRRNSTGLGGLELGMDAHDEYYFSHWIRIADGFEVCGSEGTRQWKGTRLSSDNNRVNVYWAYGCSARFNMAIEYTEPQVLGWQASIERLPDDPAADLSGWHRWDMYVRKSTTADAGDGVLQLFVDNELVYDFRRDTGEPHFDGMGFDSEGGDFARHVAIGSYFSSASDDTWIDYDDIYISHTLARVELCDRDDLSASRHCELQEPLAWSNSEVAFRANLGGLSPGEPAYLFVVSAAGEASSPYPVIIRAE